ncbi:MAG TPA: hypothetical protein VGJ37_09690 [Pyrinomonadaceae bacterium]|jgi:hypothetical protein
MKNQVIRALATISFLVAMTIVTTGSAQAQSAIRVNIPFNFTVGNKTLPAGRYSVNRFAEYASDTVVLISSADGHTKLVCLTYAAHSLDPKGKVTLIFHRYGDQNFLYQVWSADGSTGRVFAKSRSEREINRRAREAARDVVRKEPAVETVSVTVDQ